VARNAHACFAAKAFNSWRRLPRDFSPTFTARQLTLFQKSPVRPPTTALGGPVFRAFVGMLDPVTAGHLFRRRNASYATCRTLDDATFAKLLTQLPLP